MARLNDPPTAPPVESIDTLKRRFIRQNREIARVNSTQSLRIRNLEAEISRLLAENIAIREQAINIAQESEKWRAAYKASKEISDLKGRLEAKLQEVSNIVIELGKIPEKAERRASAQRVSISIPNARSPAEREWRTRQTIGGVLNAERAEQEGRLPAILEDKACPRRTMDTPDLQTPLDEAGNPLESPELGPPPIAHFDVPELVDYNQDTDPEKSPQPRIQPQPSVPLSVNLENRRKRRTSALLHNIPTEKDDVCGNDQINAQALLSLKTGAKRKLDASVLDGKKDPALVVTEEFIFKKPERDIDSRGTRFTRPVRKDGQSTAPVPSPAKDAPVVRKILAHKSTNSPMKARLRAGEKATVQSNNSEGELKIPKRPSRVDLSTTEMSREWNQADFNAVLEGAQLPPETPFSNDVLSPASTEPSARMQEMAITNSVEDVLNGSIGRGSRRARAAVSYAEPNLRDKMRRPGKELVGAVEGIDKKTREDSVDRERGRSEDPVLSSAQAKQARPDIPADWKKLPHAKEEAPSPLKDKTSKSPDDVREQKQQTVKRRLSGKAIPGISADYTGDFTITDEAELEKAVRRLSIFDPPTSSPVSGRISGGPYPDTIDVEPLKRSKSTTASERKARRHSVAANLGTILNHSRSVSEVETRPHSRQSSVSSRPGSAASQRPSSAATLRAGEKSSTLPNISRQPSTSRFVTKDKITAKADAATLSATAETRASRRKSMMV